MKRESCQKSLQGRGGGVFKRAADESEDMQPVKRLNWVDPRLHLN